MGTDGPRRAGALAVALAMAVLVADATPATAGNADNPPVRYVPSEEVPTGVRPGPAPSGFAGDKSTAPTILNSAPTFGRTAARSGIGLRTHRYSNLHGNASTLDIYTPRAFVGRKGRNVRTVILVHGGGWQAGDRTDLELQAVQLARSLKVVVVSVNYRLATEAAWPAQRDDVNAAIRFVRQNAKRFNVDNRRTAILGSSAGGQIAANVATYGPGKKRFRGLVTLSGLVSPLLMAEQNPGYSNAVVPEMLLRCLPADCPTRYQSATALTHLDRKDPPSLMFHSLNELSWGPSQARQFVRASRAIGVPATLVVLQGKRHGIDTWTTIWPTLRTWLLDRLGKVDRRI